MADHLEADLRRVREQVALKNKQLKDQIAHARNPFVSSAAAAKGNVPVLSKRPSEVRPPAAPPIRRALVPIFD